MALVKLGATVVGVSGSIGGVTFARNKAGWTAKPWSRGGKSQTEYQQLVRSYMSRWGDVWGALTPGERADWDALAVTPPEVDYDRFGVVVLRSGWQWLCRINQRMALISGTPTSLAPVAAAQVAPVITGFTAQTLTGAPNRVYCTYSNTEFAAGEFAFFFMAINPTPGQAQLRRGYMMLTIDAPAGNTSTDLTGGVATRFGGLTAGWLCSLHTYRQSADGFRSVPAVSLDVVTT